jgi:hypothetical protein
VLFFSFKTFNARTGIFSNIGNLRTPARGRGCPEAGRALGIGCKKLFSDFNLGYVEVGEI